MQQLRKALQSYSSKNDVHVLIETVQELHKHQGEFSSHGASDKKLIHRIKRDDLKLICSEYVHS